jgi:hypothetical protein
LVIVGCRQVLRHQGLFGILFESQLQRNARCQHGAHECRAKYRRARFCNASYGTGALWMEMRCNSASARPLLLPNSMTGAPRLSCFTSPHRLLLGYLQHKVGCGMGFGGSSSAPDRAWLSPGGLDLRQQRQLHRSTLDEQVRQGKGVVRGAFRKLYAIYLKVQCSWAYYLLWAPCRPGFQIGGTSIFAHCHAPVRAGFSGLTARRA